MQDGRLTPGKIDLKLRIRGLLSWLYRSRDDDRSITDAAWQRFQNGSITVEKAWPDPGRPGKPIRRYFSLPYKSIAGLVESGLIRLAF